MDNTRLLTQAEIDEAMRDMKTRQPRQMPVHVRILCALAVGIAIGGALACVSAIVIERVNYERTNAGAVWQ